MTVAGVLVVGMASWVAAPWIAMARHGTLDQQAVVAWRAEPRPPRPVDLAATIPTPRASTEAATLSA